MNALKMDTGTYHLAPLDEFVVTAKNFLRKKMTWTEWYISAGSPDYDLDNGVITFETQKDPGVDIIFPDRNPPYEVIWAK